MLLRIIFELPESPCLLDLFFSFWWVTLDFTFLNFYDFDSRLSVDFLENNCSPSKFVTSHCHIGWHVFHKGKLLVHLCVIEFLDHERREWLHIPQSSVIENLRKEGLSMLHNKGKSQHTSPSQHQFWPVVNGARSLWIRLVKVFTGLAWLHFLNQTPIVEFYMPTSVFKTTTKKTHATLKLDYVHKRIAITVHNMPIYLNLQFDAIPLLCFLPTVDKVSHN